MKDSASVLQVLQSSELGEIREASKLSISAAWINGSNYRPEHGTKLWARLRQRIAYEPSRAMPARGLLPNIVSTFKASDPGPCSQMILLIK